MISNWRSQRGGGRMGCLVALLMAGAFTYLAVKCVPVYLDKIDFEEGLARAVSQAGAQNLSAEALSKNVERVADLYEFQIEPGSLRSRRKASINGPPRLTVQLTYFRTVDFAGYNHRFSFHVKSSTFVGRL